MTTKVTALPVTVGKFAFLAQSLALARLFALMTLAQLLPLLVMTTTATVTAAAVVSALGVLALGFVLLAALLVLAQLVMSAMPLSVLALQMTLAMTVLALVSMTLMAAAHVSSMFAVRMVVSMNSSTLSKQAELTTQSADFRMSSQIMIVRFCRLLV